MLVGISVAKSLSYALDIPLTPVNHIHGHIYAFTQYQESLQYPALALIVSGGHTDLILMENEGSFKCCGKKEVDTNSVTIRRLDSNRQENMELKEFIKKYSALNKAPSI